MKKFVITTDTACDLPEDYIKQHNLKLLPLYYTFGDEVYGDDNQMEPKEFFDKMRKGSMPTTMAVNTNTATTLFTSLLNEGYDILHIAFSSALSGSCSATATAARDLCEDIPGANIKVIDSLCASLGQGLLVHKALMMKEEGKTMDEIAQWIEENKLNLCHVFTVDDLNHLHRGGRVSKTTAIIGTLINVKPVLHVDNEGRLVALNNVRGRKKALISLVNHMEKRIIGFEDKNDTVFISHGDSIDDANFVASLIKERFGIKNVLISFLSPTIGAHAGPGTIALFFVGNPR